jgi:hypothetical protein
MEINLFFYLIFVLFRTVFGHLSYGVQEEKDENRDYKGKAIFICCLRKLTIINLKYTFFEF